MPATASRLTRRDLIQIVDGMKVPLLVMTGRRVVYMNTAARGLERRLRHDHAAELLTLLSNHLSAVSVVLTEADTTTLLTAPTGETFAVQSRWLRPRHRRMAVVTVRGIGGELEAFCRRYGVTARESGVVRLLLHGYSNRDIASTLGIAPATVKRHLSRIFDKTGVDSRTQLVCRLV